MLDDYNVTIPIDVRWGDMDAYGHVNNACYFTYCESARIAWLEAVDADGARAAENHGPAVVHAECNFWRQVHHPASLLVGVKTTKLGGRSWTLGYEIIDTKTEEKVADGSSVVVWVDYGAGKSLPIPDVLRERIRALDSLD